MVRSLSCNCMSIVSMCPCILCSYACVCMCVFVYVCMYVHVCVCVCGHVTVECAHVRTYVYCMYTACTYVCS